ncbi:hypothetical protein [Streptomyces sp. NPDC001893]|uniref:hypothetical protein n=1 Tax=Streptomyces sp. NPDC001893 TaxID=3154530 RepID=UPI00333398F5
MSTSPEEPALPLITVHAKAAASAQRRVSDRLETTGARTQKIQHLLAVIKAGVLESAHVDVSALGTQAPAGRSADFGEGWLAAV